MEREAYFAGGCFWCITPVYKLQKGVLSVRSGYSGGREANPKYEEVKSGKTGHRETICVRYDDCRISYERLLEIFLLNIDPFDGGGQYIDRGRSYTTAVYYTDGQEKEKAKRALEELEKRAGKRAAVALEPFLSFYEAEPVHQDYYLTHPAEFEEEMIRSGRKKPAE